MLKDGLTLCEIVTLAPFALAAIAALAWLFYLWFIARPQLNRDFLEIERRLDELKSRRE